MRLYRIIPDILALALLYRYVFYKKWMGAQLFLKSVFLFVSMWCITCYTHAYNLKFTFDL